MLLHPLMIDRNALILDMFFLTGVISAQVYSTLSWTFIWFLMPFYYSEISISLGKSRYVSGPQMILTPYANILSLNLSAMQPNKPKILIFLFALNCLILVYIFCSAESLIAQVFKKTTLASSGVSVSSGLNNSVDFDNMDLTIYESLTFI